MQLRWVRIALACALLGALAFTAQVNAAPTKHDDDTIGEFLDELGAKDVRKHQKRLQKIADANGGTRVAGTAGFDQSAAYVVDRLRSRGYSPVVQEFPFDFFQELAPPTLSRVSPAAKDYVLGTDLEGMQYSGSGDVTAAVTPVDLVLAPPRAPSTSGCEAADFAGFVSGTIALVQRGTCTFGTKAANAQAAGAVAVIILNQGNSPDREGLLGGGTLGAAAFTVPVVFVTFAVGEELAQAGTTARVTSSTLSETRSTRNVIAETPGGDPNDVIVVGAHLDSVAGGPGINDNGSGSSAILEIALRMAKERVATGKKVRFIWFGAEEEGLVGSRFYVGSLAATELAKIHGMLNFDMIGSPNFVRFVYDGDGSAGLSNPGPPGSEAIEQAFLAYFASQGLASEPTAFDGRSDYGPFIAAGIPAGGLFTGAEGIKTDAQAAVYGGTAGQAFDPCYHQACDTFDNNSMTALDQMTDAAAYAILTLAGAADEDDDEDDD